MRLHSNPRLAEADPAAELLKFTDVSGRGALEQAIDRATLSLLADQRADGHWRYEFEADCTIPSEYILMMHFMDEIDVELERKLAVYLRENQADHGGWSLYPGGGIDVSCSVKVYYALKIAGDDIEAPHMVNAREAILAHGGAVAANVFTHIALALFEQIPWSGVPFIPVEIMLLPGWFPFHIKKVSYWSRTVMVPLFVMCSLKPRAVNPRGVDIQELFLRPPCKGDYFPTRSGLNRAFYVLDQIGRTVEPLVPRFVRRRALKQAERWVVERLNGTDGLGAIFPAMVNAHEMFAVLGFSADHPYRLATKKALRKLVVEQDELAYCQPCVSPVWDTALACHALYEASGEQKSTAVTRGLDWLVARQLTDEPGDWQDDRPDLVGGGWPFQFGNSHYPDLDDTSVVAWAMELQDPERYRRPVELAAQWLAGMQSTNGGFASFDVDNEYYYLNEIPFADHGALLDPPTADVTARCVGFFALVDKDKYRTEIDRGMALLLADQEANGSWFGRWGTNYIYGTWSVLVALEIAGVSADEPFIQRAAAWLQRVQRADGGWGESNDSYADPGLAGHASASTSFQTAWAMLALLAAGQAGSEAVRRGADFLMREQQTDGFWHDDVFTCPGFPRVFYIKYHGYLRYFPLWALARYRNLLKPRAS